MKVLNEVIGVFQIIGTVKKAVVEEISGLEPSLFVENDSATLKIDRLHPTEQLSISILVEITDHSMNPEFNLRSREVLGKSALENPLSLFGKYNTMSFS